MERRLDVSQSVWLRKRLGRAQLATKLAGIAVAPLLAGFVYGVAQRLPGWVGMCLAVGTALLSIGAGVWLARGLRRGSRPAIRFLAAIFVVYAAACALEVGYGVTTAQPTFFGQFNLLLWLGTTYFMLRGLLAVRALHNAQPAGAGQKLAPVVSPWESSRRVLRPSTFADKRNPAMYVLLALAPIPLILVLYAALSAPADASVAADANDLLGRQEGSLLIAMLVLPATVALYRTARRQAVRRATDVMTTPDRPPVLYLRSFQDDDLKMWARAADGRSWLEAALRVSFEEVVVDHLFRFGPVIAVGRPGEGEAPLGAAREYLADATWREHVRRLMQSAAVIVVVVGRSEGLLWEIGEIFASGLTHKLILLTPCLDEPDLSPRWSQLQTQLRDCAGVAADIDLRRTRAVVFPCGYGFLAIEAEERDAWSYEVALDAAVHLAQPAGVELGSLPGQALPGVPTPHTDRLGRLASGFVRGLVLTEVFRFARLIPAMALFAAGSDDARVGLVAVGACQATLTWLAGRRWLPEVAFRERLLVGALSAVEPIAPLFGAPVVPWSSTVSSIAYGVYFAIRYQGGGHPARSAVPRWIRRLSTLGSLARRLVGGLAKACLVALVVSTASNFALIAEQWAPGNAFVAAMATAATQAVTVWFISSVWLPGASIRERLLVAGISVGQILVVILPSRQGLVSYADLGAVLYGVYFAVRRDQLESRRTRPVAQRPDVTGIGVARRGRLHWPPSLPRAGH